MKKKGIIQNGIRTAKGCYTTKVLKIHRDISTKIEDIFLLHRSKISNDSIAQIIFQCVWHECTYHNTMDSL